MQRARRTVAAGLLTGGVLLVAGCSDPAPTDVPSPAPTSAAAPSTDVPSPTAGPATPSPSTSTGSSAAPRPSAPGDPRIEPSRPVETAAPKKLDEPTTTAVAKVSLTSVRASRIKTSSPVEPSGPGVVLRLNVRNTTGKTLDTSFVQVAVVNAGGAAGTMISGRPTKPLASSVKAGASADGTYAFVLADATSAPVTVQVYLTAGQPVVQFRGRAS